ncbi:hypothetical protein RB594_007145 [Gaeumannomyces avenae]
MDVDGAASEPAGDGAGPRPKLKRSRSGCLKCRIRRRKCDGVKPRCERCVRSNLECSYPSGVTFKDANNISISTSPSTGASHAASPGSSSSPYPRLQFLQPGVRSRRRQKLGSPTGVAAPQKSESILVTRQQPLESETEILRRSENHGVVHERKIITKENSREIPNVVSPASSHLLGESGCELPPEQGNRTDVEDDDESTSNGNPMPASYTQSPADGYETAVQVLVSLGSGNEPEYPITVRSRFADGHAEVESRSPYPLPSQESRLPILSSDALDEMQTLQLLTRFRYVVAQWLDLCDLHQTFGIAVPIMAARSRPVLDAMVSIATLSGSTSGSIVHCSHGTPPSLEDIVAGALDTACHFVEATPTSWRVHLAEEDFMRPALASFHDNRIWTRAICLRLRLALACALASSGEQEIQGAAMARLDSLLGLVGPTDIMFDWACRAVVLCLKVVNFCSGACQFDLSRPQAWYGLVEELASWHATQPKSFRPLIDLESTSGPAPPPESLFPVLCFTNGAAVLGNQLYHGAMLLLLRNKQRTVPPHSLQLLGAAQSSQLWHARRVCGIAMHNSHAAWWDPCLLAVVYVAASTMTYAPQQQQVLECLERVGYLTGWRAQTSYFCGALGREWGMTAV